MTAPPLFHPPDSVTTALFVAILAAVLLAFLAAVWRGAAADGARPASRTAFAALGGLVWLAVLGEFVANGAVAHAPMPAILVFAGASNLMALVLGLSPLGGSIARGVPIGALVAFQGFRLPLELVLHDWARQGTIPETMTWSGSNFDIVSGIVALLAAPFAARWRAAAWAANAIGLALLVNVGRVAILSSPLPFAWRVEPPLLLAAHLPYAFILPVCVAGALLGHVVLTRALLRPRGVR
ncbi:MAG TPA: hypothetical protein VFS09_11660 [Candidatus Eisenbacteria bacterium]|nr:hypothetical protein [Candidatus Eisenbacteria bacterium]